jgi:opacity protein-like surface antigen
MRQKGIERTIKNRIHEETPMKIKRIVRTSGLAVLILSSLSLRGFADDADLEHSSFSIGPRAAYYNPKGDAGEAKWYAGAQTRLFMGSALALEGSVDYYRRDFNPTTRLKVYPVQASLLAYIAPQYQVSPFLLAGAGWYFTRIEGPAGFHETQDRSGLHAGGGLEIKVNSSFSIDGTYRYLWIEDLQSVDQSALDKDFEDSGSQVTIGLNLHF